MTVQNTNPDEEGVDISLDEDIIFPDVVTCQSIIDYTDRYFCSTGDAIALLNEEKIDKIEDEELKRLINEMIKSWILLNSYINAHGESYEKW
jgi:hypothetical protein